MFSFIKLLLFVCINILTILFLFYVHLEFMLDMYFQWFFNDIRDMQQYDYIIGKPDLFKIEENDRITKSINIFYSMNLYMTSCHNNKCLQISNRCTFK